MATIFSCFKSFNPTSVGPSGGILSYAVQIGIVAVKACFALRRPFCLVLDIFIFFSLRQNRTREIPAIFIIANQIMALARELSKWEIQPSEKGK